MIRQYDAQRLVESALRKYKPVYDTSNTDVTLWEQGWRCNFTKVDKWIALCDHTHKRIIVSIPHLNARSEAEFMDTNLHEIAHAIVGPGHNHGAVWQAKAIELGAKPTPCSPSNVDAGRSINIAETKEAPQLKAVQKSCPDCGAVATEKSHKNKLNRITGKVERVITLECGHTVHQHKIKDSLAGLSKWTSASGKLIYPYQVEGIKFVGKANGRALIADEPGLGKTGQAIGSLYFYEEMCPALWVCKSTLTLQTVKEAFDWGGKKMISQVIDHSRAYIIPGLNLYIISMDLLRRMPTEKLESIPFKTVVVDEVQHFKDPDSTRTGELRKLVARAEYFLALSGTPWKNRGSEYYPVLNMLMPETFSDPKRFRWKWIDYWFDKKTGKQREGGIKNIPAFREITKNNIIRRMRDDVLPDLPKIRRELRFVDMEAHAEEYDKAESKLANLLKAAIIDGVDARGLASMIMSLKHITGVAKVKSCVDDCTEWLENVPDDFEKLTIFHHHIDVGDYLQHGMPNEYDGLDKWLTDNDYKPTLRLYGGRSPEERDNIIQRFMKDPKRRVLIASTLASGEGLNIQFCQNAYMLERQWNPQNEEQAELRFSRPITKSTLPEYLWPIADRKISIRVPYFIAANTVDEILTNLVEGKRIQFRKTMNVKDEFITWDEAELVHAVAEAIIKKRFKKTA